jgi:hypothetical protein
MWRSAFCQKCFALRCISAHNASLVMLTVSMVSVIATLERGASLYLYRALQSFIEPTNSEHNNTERKNPNYLV